MFDDLRYCLLSITLIWVCSLHKASYNLYSKTYNIVHKSYGLTRGIWGLLYISSWNWNNIIWNQQAPLNKFLSAFAFSVNTAEEKKNNYERERDQYWALQESKDHHEKSKSRENRRRLKKSASGEHKGQEYKQIEEKENTFRNILFFYMLAVMDGAETCASQRQTVNWRLYDCDMILMPWPRPQHHPPIRGDIWQRSWTLHD